MTKGRIEAFSDGVMAIIITIMVLELKGKISPLIYAIAIPLAYVSPWISGALYVLVAIIWLVPDPRIERVHQAPA